MDRQPSAAKGIEVVERVLVVDDDQDIRELLQMLLEGEGYQVATAADGVAAVEFLTRAEDVWIVLLDIMLPRLDGLEVCARLSATGPPAARHRVALMTAGRLELKDYHAPGRTLLRKPFNLETVRNLVAALAHDQAEYGNWPEQPSDPFTSERYP
jgi:two-component system, OmpR family, response regulator MprA